MIPFEDSSAIAAAHFAAVAGLVSDKSKSRIRLNKALSNPVILAARQDDSSKSGVSCP
jgi:hypothetical protein